MWIDKNDDNGLAVADFKFSDTAVEVESLPADQAFLTWNDADPKNPIVDETKVLESQGQAIADAIQAHMDDTAKAFGFRTGMDRAVSYVNSTDLTFKGYAETLNAWRDAWWKHSETEEAKVLAGTRTMPTVDEMMAELEAVHATPTL